MDRKDKKEKKKESFYGFSSFWFFFGNKGKHLRHFSYKKEVFFNVEEQNTKNTNQHHHELK